MATKKKLSPSTQKYLEEVWGYKTVGEIDKLTLECIQENVDDEGFPADVEIIEARKNQ